MVEVELLLRQEPFAHPASRGQEAVVAGGFFCGGLNPNSLQKNDENKDWSYINYIEYDRILLKKKRSAGVF